MTRAYTFEQLVSLFAYLSVNGLYGLCGLYGRAFYYLSRCGCEACGTVRPQVW